MPLQILHRFKKSNFSKLNSRRVQQVRNIVKRNNTKKKNYLLTMSGGALKFKNIIAANITKILMSKNVPEVMNEYKKIHEVWTPYFVLSGRMDSTFSPNTDLLIALHENDDNNNTRLLHVFAEKASLKTTLKLFFNTEMENNIKDIMNDGEGMFGDNPLICFFKKLQQLQKEGNNTLTSFGESEMYLLYDMHLQAFMYTNTNNETAANFLDETNFEILTKANKHKIDSQKHEIEIDLPQQILVLNTKKQKIEDNIKQIHEEKKIKHEILTACIAHASTLSTLSNLSKLKIVQ